MSTDPRSLACRSVSAHGAWPAARARRPPLARRHRPRAPGRGPDRSVGAERVERPVLQEDVDRLAQRGGTGGQDRGSLELVVRAGEEDQVQGLVHRVTSCAMRSPRTVGGAATGLVSDSCARRRSRRSRTPRMMLAGDDHVRVGQPVADLTTLPVGIDQARCPQHGEVLRDVGLADAEHLGQAADFAWPGGESVQDLQPSWAGERPQDLGLEDRDLVHDPSIDTCASAASVPAVTVSGADPPASARAWSRGRATPANPTDGPT